MFFCFSSNFCKFSENLYNWENNFYSMRSSDIFAQKRGFTIVELMIVLVILGILFVSISNLFARASIDQKQAENFANFVNDTIRDTRQNVVIGKNDRTLTGTTDRTVEISKENISVFFGTGANKTFDLDNTKISGWLFEHDPRYIIEGVYVSSGTLYENNSNPLANGKIWTEVKKLDLTFSSDLRIAVKSEPVIDNIQSYKIVTNFLGFRRYIYGDAVVGYLNISGTNDANTMIPLSIAP